MMNKLLLSTGLGVLLSVTAFAESCEIAKIKFESPKGELRDAFTYELADTEELRQQGLMYRRYLQTNHGMLFSWEEPQKLAMWMKHTYIPLDMIYMREGYVTGIIHRAKPHSEEIVGYNLPESDAILEVISETAEKRNIKVGDKAIRFKEPAACK